MRHLFVIAASFALVVGCKKKEKAPVADPVPPVAGSAMVGSGSGSGTAMGSGSAMDPGATGTFPLATGETYYGGSPMATNQVDWKLPDGSIVQLGIVTTGKSADGRDQGVLRAFHAGAAHDVDQKYSLDSKLDHWAELKVLPNNRVMFRHGEAGTGPRARNAVLLRWDDEAKRVRVAKRWAGTSKEQEPAWLLTGEYKAAPESHDLCLKVIARMVECEKDEGFRQAIFTRDNPADKAAMQEHFDSHIVKWKTADGAKEQCNKWATDEYVDTHFSEATALKRLAAETKNKCNFFGAEVVDEGGLPVALTDAKPHAAGEKKQPAPN